MTEQGRGGLRVGLPTDRTDRYGIIALLAIGLLAFLVRLIGVLWGGGLTGSLGFDDTVYYTAAVSFVEGRLPYRDFNTLHPPGYFYALSPFALVAGATNETTGFAVARLAFMTLGAINTVLVGLVGRRVGWGTALCAAALYAVWMVPQQVERTAYLIAPQTAMLLLALLQLTGRGPEGLTGRRVVIAGVCLGIAGVMQIWMAVPAAIIAGWLAWTCRRAPRQALRVVATFVASGALTALALLLPFLITTGQRMIQMVLFAQAGRVGPSGPTTFQRLRMLEGLNLGDLVPRAVVLGVFVLAVALVLYAAWRRPAIRLWVAILAGELLFLMWTPVFFGHYAGWPAPLVALSIGAGVALVLEQLPFRPRQVAIAGYGIGLALMLVVSIRPRGQPAPLSPDLPALAGARCVTADMPILLISSHTLIRSLDNGCELLPNPRSISHFYNVVRSGEKLNRSEQPEYQETMGSYFSSGDAALFGRLKKFSLTDETEARIRAALPNETRVGDVLVLTRGEP